MAMAQSLLLLSGHSTSGTLSLGGGSSSGGVGDIGTHSTITMDGRSVGSSGVIKYYHR